MQKLCRLEVFRQAGTFFANTSRYEDSSKKFLAGFEQKNVHHHLTMTEIAKALKWESHVKPIFRMMQWEGTVGKNAQFSRIRKIHFCDFQSG